MSFADKQGSQHGGKPVRLYEFRIGRYPYDTGSGDTGYIDLLSWGEAMYRLNDSDADFTITVAGESAFWQGNNISDNGFRFSGAATSDGYEVTLPASHELAQKFRGSPPAQTVALTVYDVHATDGLLEAQVVWVGEVAECKFPSPEKAQFTCVTIAAAFQRMGLRLAWEKNCPHMLYDRQCTMNIRDHSIDTTITAIVNGTHITVAATLSARYHGGIIYWTHADGYEESLGIDGVEPGGNLIRVFGLTDKLFGVTNVKLAYGCQRTTTACAEFGNSMNYGGAPHLPEKNPFDGSPVF